MSMWVKILETVLIVYGVWSKRMEKGPVDGIVLAQSFYFGCFAFWKDDNGVTPSKLMIYIVVCGTCYGTEWGGGDQGNCSHVGGISVLNHFYGRDDIPIGGYKGPFGRDPSGNWVLGKYLQNIVSMYPSPIKNLTQVPDATTVYRKALAEAEPQSVSIASIGFLMNLRDLLQSPGDAISPMSGVDLVAAKVKKIVFMGGWWPPLHPLGYGTYNFNCGGGVYAVSDCFNSTKTAIELLPSSVELIFSDLGDEIFSGGILTNAANSSNPCRQALMDQQGPGNGRCDWDPLVTITAVRGVEGMWAFEQGKGGHITITDDGANNWVPGNSSNQSYINLNGDENMLRTAVGSIIDGLLLQPPKINE